MWTSCFLVTWTNVNWFILSWANWTLSQLLWGVNSLWLTALSSKFSHSFGSRSRSQCLKSSLVLLVSVLFTEWKSGLWFFISQHNSTNILSNASHYFIAPPNDKYYYKAPRWSFPPPDHEYLIICCLFLSQHIFLGGVCVVVFFFFFFYKWMWWHFNSWVFSGRCTMAAHWVWWAGGRGVLWVMCPRPPIRANQNRSVDSLSDCAECLSTLQEPRGGHDGSAVIT